MRTIHVIGIGVGDPDYVTTQAIRALRDTQVFFAMDKGAAKSDLVALRREICRRFIPDAGYRFVEVPDPSRADVASGGAAVVHVDVDPVKHMWAPGLMHFKDMHLEPKGK